MMERRQSTKKIRSYGGTPKGSRNSQSSLSTSNAVRSQYRERVKSAPSNGHWTEEYQKQSKNLDSTRIGKSGSDNETSASSLHPRATLSSPIFKSHTHQSIHESDCNLAISSTTGHVKGANAEYNGKRRSPGEFQAVSLAVLGAPTVGKSTFVHCALDLKKPSLSPVSSKKVSLEGQISIVRLFELGLDDVEVTSEQRMRWPDKVGDESTPHIDGVLALYDVMDQSSITPIPLLLSESSRLLCSLCNA